jgi:hypothetical protein
VDWIVIYHMDIDLFMVLEYAPAPKWVRPCYVSVCEDISIET